MACADDKVSDADVQRALAEINRPGPEFMSVQETIDHLERIGVVMKNGMFRPGRDGRPQPVYVATPLGRRVFAVQDEMKRRCR